MVCDPKGSVMVEDPGFEDLEGIPIASASGQVVVRATLKQADSVPGPRIEVEMFVGAVHVLLSPYQLHSLLEMMASLSTKGTTVCVLGMYEWSYLHVLAICLLQLLVDNLWGQG